ncbi:MAG: aminotransferase class I/II-fold pyridoxal phosphate-dependent enzyme [Burkholderiaceae bacterium]|jgi:histidinol-phosphate aminotransferase|nr:aminotransferase class I/II-fold pyridoxal phosphate-dependent enzyme [Burkholderiaceae bacterium]
MAAFEHGGPDALGVAAHDLSTNANALGPCPLALAALRAADAARYPDPAYTRLSAQLADWHRVAPQRVVLAASASEFIQRITLAVALLQQRCAGVWLPEHAYGDYARAARAAGLARVARAAQAALIWAAEPSSPLGQAQANLAAQVAALRGGQTLVLDQAYEPLRLSGAPSLTDDALPRVWRLITPNKALGLCGVRAAYAIAPGDNDAQHTARLLARVWQMAPSWPVGAHGVALLQVWASAPAQTWLAESRASLRNWKARQIEWLQADGWQIAPGAANFLVATRASFSALRVRALLAALRPLGFKLRDCASFGLPGHVRMSVAAPNVQDALRHALRTLAQGNGPLAQENTCRKDQHAAHCKAVDGPMALLNLR